MPQDIRSFFTVVSKKQGAESVSKKRSIPIDSSDEDLVADTPEKIEPKKSKKKRKVIVLSSDSEDENNTNTKKAEPTPEKSKIAKKEKENIKNGNEKQVSNGSAPVVVMSSDSEDEKSKTNSKKAEPTPDKSKIAKKDKENIKNGYKKPVSLFEAFGSAPVKQSKVEELPEVNKEPVEPVAGKSKNSKGESKNATVAKHGDDYFEETLRELDDEDFDSILDQTVEEVEKALIKTSRDKYKDAIKKEEETEDTADNKKEEPSENVKEEKVSLKKEESTSTPGKTPNRKRKAEEADLDSSIDPDQDRYERRRHSAILYQKYLHRGRPEHHGAKELPQGKPDCLKNLCFLRTGVLDSLENDEFDNLVKEHGGRTVHSVSKKVNYLVVGKEPGPAKMEKAQNLGIKLLSEDELLDLILVKSGMKPKYCKVDESGDNMVEDQDIEMKEEKSPAKKDKTPVKKDKKTPVKNDKKSENGEKKTPKKEKTTPKKEKTTPSKEDKMPKKNVERNLNLDKLKKPSKCEEEGPVKKEGKSKNLDRKDLPKFVREKVEVKDENLAWTEKYKPKTTQAIIGQQGNASNLKKLTNWLNSWHKYHSGKNRPKLVKPSPWAKDDNGSYYKAVLLSGPPGVGKTTTATLVAKELGFDVVEFNASDTRNKRLLHEEVSQLLSTTSLAGYFQNGSAPTRKHVLLMDEVDGMSGNEDRGGMLELINLIKSTNVPIICMCNDRNHQKMRSLVNYCYDLRFNRPRMEQIRGAMLSICFKEGIKISPDALGQMITGAGMDIRQILNHLSMWSANEKNLSKEVVQKETNAAKKDTVLGPWEVCRKVFSEEDHKTMSLEDKSRLFFFDYSLAPLFVQENYLSVVPHCPESEKLERICKAADALSLSDIVDKKIRSSNNWSLLGVQAMYASVMPGHFMEGHVGGQINFPGWLGKNSRRGKFQRLVCELQAHMRTSISGSRESVNLDYIYHIRDRIVEPLDKEGAAGVDKAIEVMNAYNLTREDFDHLLELTQWPHTKDPMRLVDSKVKSAFTRTYNKKVILPYAIATAPVKKKTSANTDMDYGDLEEEEEDGEADNDNVNNDAMIKEKKKAAPKGGKKEKTKDEACTSTTRKKGGSRGKKNKN